MQHAADTVENLHNETKKQLEESRSHLTQIENKLKDIQTELTTTQNKEKELTSSVKSTQKRIARAEKLLTGLSDELKRCEQSAVKLKNSTKSFLVTQFLFLQFLCTLVFSHHHIVKELLRNGSTF